MERLRETLLAVLRQRTFGFALLLGLVVSGVLAFPWFGGRRESPGVMPPVAEVEARAPSPAPREAAPAPPPAPPAQESPQIAAPPPAETPVYHPDAALAGGSLASVRSAPGIRAGVASALPEIRALGPEHVGATTRAAPTLYWFLSDASSVAVEIRLRSDQAGDPLLELRMEPPVAAGLHALHLERRRVALQPGITYRWSVALVADPAHREEDLVSGAAVRRADADGALTQQLAAAGPAERAHRLAAAGYWYDAFDLLTDSIQAEPASERLREHRAALLDQVGLAGVGGLLSGPAAPSEPAGDP